MIIIHVHHFGLGSRLNMEAGRVLDIGSFARVSMIVACVSVGMCLPSARVSANETGQLRFNRDVRPILAAHCFHCHGPDEAESGLRLDFAEGIADAFSEMDLNENTGWQRLISKDPDEKMPPPAPGNEVSAEELVVLRQWISQGAGYEMHWSYVRPTRPDVPKTDLAKRVRNPIDAFVLRKLDQQRLSPSSEATREQLIRRLSLDLTGLPPSPAEVEAFVSDQRRDAYEKLVDHLLGSRHFGERLRRAASNGSRQRGRCGDRPAGSIRASTAAQGGEPAA